MKTTNSTETNLAYLMSVFNMSSKNLAASLNVHFSLVSKWKHNKRLLVGKSEYAGQIADIFIAIDEPQKYRRIKAILSEFYPDEIFSKHEAIRKRLESWLTEQFKEAPETNINLENVFAHAVVDVYRGSDGKNSCLERIANIALTLGPGSKMYIWDNQRMHAFLDPNEAPPDSNEKYRDFLLKRDGIITTIHTLNRKPQELFYSILRMLPLYTTGKATAYCQYDYTDPPVKFSIFMLEDAACALSIEFFDNKASNTSYFTTDPTTLSNIAQIYKTMLPECVPLFDPKAFLKPGKAQRTLKDIFESKGVTYCLRAQVLPLYTMSAKLYERLLDVNNYIGEDRERLKQTHLDLHKAFLRSIEHNDFRILLLLPESPEMFLLETHYSATPLRVTPEIFMEHINETDRLVRRKAHLKIFAADSLFLPPWHNINVIIKENQAIMTTSTESINGLHLKIDDPVVMNAFFAGMNKHWYSIPTVKEYTSLPNIFMPYLKEKTDKTT